MTGLLLLAGVPPFLRMPPWCDLTLYQVAAQTVTAGGVHYRDVFDTNLPGFVWLMAGVRWLLGSSTEAVRAVDLVCVGMAVGLLGGLARRAGATPAGVAWMAAGAALFYPFSPESNHGQRDVWMLLPAVVAVRLRLARPFAGRPFVQGLAEGMVWGVGVWIKPHLLVPAATVWLLTAERGRRPADLLGNLVGGLVVGAAGVGWLVGTGAWPHFLDVFQNWNRQYVWGVWVDIRYHHVFRLLGVCRYFPPWSFLLPVAAGLAVLMLRPPRRPRWWFVPAADDREAVARRAVAGLLLAWAAQAFLIQRTFSYVHVPETLLLMAVFAVQRWAVTPAVLVYLAASAAVAAGYDARLPPRCARPAGRPLAGCVATVALPRHPLASADRWGRWADCWRPDLPPAAADRVRDEMSLQPNTFCTVGMAEIGQVADELTRRGAIDGEVLSWHSSPHAVYLRLGHQPRFRFMQVGIARSGDPADPRSPYRRMRAELEAVVPGTRYVVSDLTRTFAFGSRPLDRMREAGQDLLPPALPAAARDAFPYNQPVVFRSQDSAGRPGRYLIHELIRPVGRTDFEVDIWGGGP